MSTKKILQAPPGVTCCTIDGVAYEPDVKGRVRLVVDSHESQLRAHGFRDIGENMPDAADKAKAATDAAKTYEPDRCPAAPETLAFLAKHGIETGPDVSAVAVVNAVETILTSMRNVEDAPRIIADAPARELPGAVDEDEEPGHSDEAPPPPANDLNAQIAALPTDLGALRTWLTGRGVTFHNMANSAALRRMAIGHLEGQA